MWLPENSWAYRTFDALDKRFARIVMGFSGEKTASVECATCTHLRCRILCGLMSFIEHDHCNKALAAYNRRLEK
jgi:hypothetical protein